VSPSSGAGKSSGMIVISSSSDTCSHGQLLKRRRSQPRRSSLVLRYHPVGRGRHLLLEDADGGAHAREVDRVAHLRTRGGQGLSGVCAACDDSPQTTDASRDLQQCCDGGHGPWSVGCASGVRTVRALAKKGMRLRLER